MIVDFAEVEHRLIQALCPGYLSERTERMLERLREANDLE
jgi:hypothetical protein